MQAEPVQIKSHNHGDQQLQLALKVTCETYIFVNYSTEKAYYNIIL